VAKPLHVEPWSWTLEQAAPGLVLSVVCGTVGLYERAIVLSRDEVKIWVDGGPAALERSSRRSATMSPVPISPTATGRICSSRDETPDNG